MQRHARLRLILWLALCACGCAHLPTVGLGVRSSWRSRERPADRHVEVLAGVSIGWSGASSAARPRIAAIDEDPYAVAERALAYDGPVCLEALFCEWESTAREGALAREGVRDETREGVRDETREGVRDETREGVPDQAREELEDADLEGLMP